MIILKMKVVIMIKGQKINTPHKFKNVGKYSLNYVFQKLFSTFLFNFFRFI